MQNKANFKMGNINISIARTKAYAKEQRTINNERYSKQTQSNPISSAETAYSPCRARDCRGPGGLAMAIARGDGERVWFTGLEARATGA